MLGKEVALRLNYVTKWAGYLLGYKCKWHYDHKANVIWFTHNRKPIIHVSLDMVKSADESYINTTVVFAIIWFYELYVK